MTVKQNEDKNNPNLEQNKGDAPLSHMSKVIMIGFLGGVFWSLIGYIAYYFNFTKLGPSLILQPWTIGAWKYGTIGQWIGIILIGLFSIGAALIYNVFLKNTQKIWPGMLFGIALWLLVFYVLNPIFPNLESVREFGRNTIITTLCLYILYGVFVGYSISYDHEQMKQA
ncbi:YqhR family membrane protein [Schinkia sp. CFF1]